jgi:hypothetical protein
MFRDCENIVIIPSLIYCDSGIYSKDERFEQTKETIKTVKQKIPNSFIVLIDISKFNGDEIEYFKNNCDMFLNPSDDMELAEKIIGRKSYGEKTYLQYTINLLNNNENVYNFNNFPNLKHIFKVGGRYFLNDHFNYDNFNNEFDNIKIVSDSIYKNTCYTSCFKISKQNVSYLIDSFKIFDNELKNNFYDIETMLFKHINRIPEGINKQVEILGITCLSAVASVIIYE